MRESLVFVEVVNHCFFGVLIRGMSFGILFPKFIFVVLYSGCFMFCFGTV